MTESKENNNNNPKFFLRKTFSPVKPVSKYHTQEKIPFFKRLYNKASTAWNDSYGRRIILFVGAICLSVSFIVAPKFNMYLKNRSKKLEEEEEVNENNNQQ
ncbi:hypothetical protein ABK040_009595 [Willaertia magna]